ncbi:unknown protein [Paenibacillus amylolyticus]|uniref:Uncharacterized protein n=1 Tax=Paenibacillus amylolyticus TaxID=1451 RepID=A0A117I093_PAEAM|nr:unknown protein [Paenibacillus amylolyticus]
MFFFESRDAFPDLVAYIVIASKHRAILSLYGFYDANSLCMSITQNVDAYSISIKNEMDECES